MKRLGIAVVVVFFAMTAFLQAQALPIRLAGVWNVYEAGKMLGTGQVLQTGRSLTFINERGNRSQGAFKNETTIVATDWGNLQGGLAEGGRRINWANNSWWILKESSTEPIQLAGVWNVYVAGKMLGTGQVLQTSLSLTFINERGNRSQGTIKNETTVVATDWGNLQGGLAEGGRRINWANGSYWTRDSAQDPIQSLTGPWVHSADPNFHTDDSKVIVIQDGNRVTLTQTYKVSGRWVTLVCQGSISGQDLRMQCNWAPGGNPFGFANTTLNLKLSSDGNHLDGTISPNTGSSQESHYSRVPGGSTK